ncbi:hypothetical protein BDN67DRAFT_591393 [Paxillus ammoniavirescens]|nr:hypothetical protein BDN67DRAFT_591393 [Paxillus ammoniavirescens]
MATFDSLSQRNSREVLRETIFGVKASCSPRTYTRTATRSSVVLMMFRAALCCCVVTFLGILAQDIQATQVPLGYGHSDWRPPAVADDGLENWNMDHHPNPNATGHLVFETVNSLLQYWPNTRMRNGKEYIPFFAVSSCTCSQVIRWYREPFQKEHFSIMGRVRTNCRQVPTGLPLILNTLSSSAGVGLEKDVGISHLLRLDPLRWSILMEAVRRRLSMGQWTPKILSHGVLRDLGGHSRRYRGSGTSVNGAKITVWMAS